MHPDKPIDIKFKRDPKDGFPHYLGRYGVADASGIHISREFEFNGRAVRILSPINGRGDISQSCRIFIPTEALHALALALFGSTHVAVHVEGGVVQDVTADEESVKVCVVDEDNIEAGDKRPNLRRESSFSYPVGYLPTPRKK